MTRHATSLRRLLALAALAVCEATLRALAALVDRAARKRPEGSTWQPDEDAR